MSTQEFRLQRQAAVDLVFDGELLADESSDDGERDRWQEVRIYRTTTNRWVVERTGRSRVPGEVDLPQVTVCRTPDEVRQALTFSHTTTDGQRRRYVTDIGYDALNQAADLDPELEDALVERV